MYEIAGILIALLGLTLVIFGVPLARKMVDSLPNTFPKSQLQQYEIRLRTTGIAIFLIGIIVSRSQHPIYAP